MKSDTEPKPAQVLLYLFYAILVCALIFGVWRLTLFYRENGLGMVQQYLDRFGQGPWLFIAVLAAFVAGTVLLLPVTLLVVAANSIYGPAAAFFLSLCGIGLNATTGYLIGKGLGFSLMDRFFPEAGKWTDQKISQWNAAHLAGIRMLPFAHFASISMICGAGHVAYRSFIAGTLAGVLPGLIALVLFQQSLFELLKSPDAGSLLRLALVTAGIIGLYYLLKRKGRECSR